ncbi:MAG: PEPxxWA-CTERM sorting domain-containing protein [Patescibacteria group bacterium]
MKSFFTTGLAGLALAALLSAPASAAITLDGLYDAAYGAPKSLVSYDPGAPLGNFAAPGTTNHAAAYAIFLASDATAVYGLLLGDRVSGLPFANLYFDIDPANNNGSDIGFEITNDRAFVPGIAGYSGPLAGLSYALSGDGKSLEFSIQNALFTSAIPGLTYYGGQEFPSFGDFVTLRLSQSLGYSVAGGAPYGPNRLGAVTIQGPAAVPEPATWAFLILGFGLTGVMLRRRHFVPVLAR